MRPQFRHSDEPVTAISSLQNFQLGRNLDDVRVLAAPFGERGVPKSFLRVFEFLKTPSIEKAASVRPVAHAGRGDDVELDLGHVHAFVIIDRLTYRTR